MIYTPEAKIPLPTPKHLLSACPQCGAGDDWIEQYESVNRYNSVVMNFAEDGTIDAFDVVIGQTQEDQTETIELRCRECGTELTDEAAAIVEAMFE